MGNGPCLANFEGVKCSDCRKWFSNQECYQRHLKGPCEEFHLCEACKHAYSVSKGHECDSPYCPLCNRYHSKEQRCFIQPIYNKKKEEDFRILVFDLEVYFP